LPAFGGVAVRDGVTPTEPRNAHHGHLDESLVSGKVTDTHPELLGLPDAAAGHTGIAPFKAQS
jgi:hypothetical protein